MPTSTRWLLVEHMIDSYQLGRRGTNDFNSADKVTLSDDSQFGGPNGSPQIQRGCDLRLRQNAVPGDTGANTYDGSRLDTRPSLAAGRFTIDPAFVNAATLENFDPAANLTEFQVLFEPLRFDELQAAINDALRKYIWELRLQPITEVPNGDFRDFNATTLVPTSWNVGTIGTVVTESFPRVGLVLSVVRGITTTFVESASVRVEPSASYFFEVGSRIVTAAAASVVVILRDNSNAADISLDDDDITYGEPVLLVNPSVTMPTGCEVVTVRLPTSTVLSDETRYSNVILRKNEAREFPIQDRTLSVLRLGRLLATKQDTWARRAGEWEEVPHKLRQVEQGRWVYDALEDLSGWSVWYEEYIRPAAMTADSDTTSIPIEDIGAMATAILLRPLRRSPLWREKYEEAERHAGNVRNRYQHTLRKVVREQPRALVLPYH